MKDDESPGLSSVCERFPLQFLNHIGDASRRFRSKVIETKSGSPTLYRLQFVDEIFGVRFPHAR